MHRPCSLRFLSPRSACSFYYFIPAKSIIEAFHLFKDSSTEGVGEEEEEKEEGKVREEQGKYDKR